MKHLIIFCLGLFLLTGCREDTPKEPEVTRGEEFPSKYMGHYSIYEKGGDLRTVPTHTPYYIRLLENGRIEIKIPKLEGVFYSNSNSLHCVGGVAAIGTHKSNGKDVVIYVDTADKKSKGRSQYTNVIIVYTGIEKKLNGSSEFSGWVLNWACDK